MEKVVIFDWGGVVESHENKMENLRNAKIRLLKRFNENLSDEEFLNGWPTTTSEGISLSVENNPTLLNDWYNLLAKNMNINVPFQEFKEAYEEEMSSVKYYRNVVEYAHSLKDKCKIAILSNLIFLDKKRIDEQYNLSKFDKVYLSFEIGMRKPNKEIYEYVTNDLETNPENILFIDDDEKNILMAQKCGWNTCQAHGYELDKIKKEVEKFLIK